LVGPVKASKEIRVILGVLQNENIQARIGHSGDGDKGGEELGIGRGKRKSEKLRIAEGTDAARTKGA